MKDCQTNFACIGGSIFTKKYIWGHIGGSIFTKNIFGVTLEVAFLQKKYIWGHIGVFCVAKKMYKVVTMEVRCSLTQI